MEKASEVYNKLKLRFVGKSDVPGKPQTDDKETEDNDKEPEEEGKQKIQALDILVLVHFAHLYQSVFSRLHSSERGI